MLHRLEREQFLLVPLDEVGGWFRYHHLLREYLTDRLDAQMAVKSLSKIAGPTAGLRRRRNGRRRFSTRSRPETSLRRSNLSKTAQWHWW